MKLPIYMKAGKDNISITVKWWGVLYLKLRNLFVVTMPKPTNRYPIHSERFIEGLVKALDIDTKHITHISIDAPHNSPVTLKVHSLITVEGSEKLNKLLKEYEIIKGKK